MIHAKIASRWGGAVLLFACTLLLGGCNRPQPGVPTLQGAPPTAKSVAAPAVTAAFALASARPEPYEGQLALVLEFNQRLAGAQAFDTLLVVKDSKGAAVSGSWALDEDGKLLRFPYVKADATYRLHIDAAVTAADGKTLGVPIEREVYTGPMQPAVGFASQGSVLPARESRGLPVVSVNVSEVDVEFFRVHDGELSNFFAAYQRSGKRSGWDLDPQYGWYGRKGKPLTAIADSVYANRFALDGKQNERTLSYLPIRNIAELSRPGLYFAALRRAGNLRDQYDTSFFFVSDIGLHARAYKDTLFVHAASLLTGEPLAGIELAVHDAKGSTLIAGKTGADGNALLAYTLHADQVLVASRGQDVSLLPFNQPALDLSEFDVAGRKQEWFDVFAWSGRDLYRPGETVRLSALLRDFDGKRLKPQPLFVTLKQPDGRPYASARLEARELEYYEWSRLVPADAPTGKWQVEFRLDPASKQATQSLAFRIEEFLPERLKLDLDSAAPTLAPSAPLKLAVQADYLYGAPAAGNRFTARLTLAPDVHPVEALKDYAFGDPTLDLPKQAQDVADAALDADGKLQVDIAIPDSAKARAPIAAIVSGSVYETGGRTVTRTLKRTLWPADALVGVRPLFDPAQGSNANARAAFELVRSNVVGERLAAQQLAVKLVRENRAYHWTYDNDSGWHFDYNTSFDDVQGQLVDIPAGASAKFDVPVEWGNYRLEVTDPSTGLVMRYPFFAGWSWDDQNRGKEARPDKVKLALDKAGYRAGDTLKVTLTPPHPGKGVLLVESDHLLYTRAIDAQPGVVFEIPVTADWERHDVYVTALVFRGGSAASKITPARAIGEAFVPMQRAARKLDVSVQAPATMKPEADLPVTVKAPALAGKKAFVTVSAVDVGILNITRFALPDPLGWFFGQRRLGVDAYDLYGRVIESFDGGMARLRYGGDMVLDALPQARRPTAHVQTVDLFSGAVALDARGEATLALPMPDFNGTVRITALVFGEDRYGARDTETVVRAPLVAEVSTPRVLAPGDQAHLTLDLQNFSGAANSFAIEVSAQAPLAIARGTRTVKLADKAKATLDFPLSAAQGNGVGRIKVRASGPGVSIDRHFELAVRPAWPAVLTSSARALQKPEPIVLGAELLAGLVPDSVQARLTISSLPPLPFASALAGLLQYPYGCIEQTTSKAWGNLLLDAKTADSLHVAAITPDQRKLRIDTALGRIASMQVPSGHFSMWGGEGYVPVQLTPYVVDFLETAREDGFLVSEDVLQKALKRLNDDLLGGGNPFYDYEHSDALRFANQAYSAFVLARVNRAPLGTLRTLFDNDRGKSLTALPLVHLGIALKLMGDAPRAAKAIAEAFEKKVDRPWYLGDYGSELRDVALMVALTHQYGLARPEYDGRVFALARSLTSQQREADAEQKRAAFHWNWLSTQEQIAVARLGKALLGDGDSVVSGTLSIGADSSPISPDRIWSRGFDAAELRAGVRLQPDGDVPLYVNTDIVGVPTRAPAADDQYASIRRSYFTLDGKPWQPAPLKEGDALIVGLVVEAREAMPDALITDLLPGGLEIENFNLTDAKQWADVVVDGITLSDRGSAAEVRHEEFREDRYVAALKLDKGQQAHVFYLVRAVSPGTFGVPPPLVEDMYLAQMRGIGKAQPASVTVVEP